MRVASLLLAASCLFAQYHRDWAKHPAIVEMNTDADIFAIGDIHADADRLTALLVGAKLIARDPGGLAWIGGKSVLVVTGDFIDKWHQALQVIAILRGIQNAAAKAGGSVIILAGNHEVEFLASPHSKKSEEFVSELKHFHIGAGDVAACTGDLGEFFCGLPFGARVNNWFFSHAGNTHGRTIQQLNSDIQSGVDRDGFATRQLLDPDSILEARLGDDPWFARKGADPKKTLEAYASALGVTHIVQGHQPSLVTFPDGIERKPGEIFQRYGLIFLEDTGMSQGVDHSHGALLRIGKHQADGVCADGTSAVIWSDSSTMDAGKMAPCAVRSHSGQ